MEKLPLEPLPEAESGGIGQAIATYALSAVASAGLLILCLPMTHTCGASRSAQLRRAQARQEALDASRTSPEEPPSADSTPSR